MQEQDLGGIFAKMIVNNFAEGFWSIVAVILIYQILFFLFAELAIILHLNWAKYVNKLTNNKAMRYFMKIITVCAVVVPVFTAGAIFYEYVGQFLLADSDFIFFRGLFLEVFLSVMFFIIIRIFIKHYPQINKCLS